MVFTGQTLALPVRGWEERSETGKHWDSFGAGWKHGPPAR
jgi:hypothetical protein